MICYFFFAISGICVSIIAGEPGGCRLWVAQSRTRLKQLSSSSSFTTELSVSSVTQLCPTLCNPMDFSTPGFPVHHQIQNLLKLMSI